jgi:hypothetical protein
VRDFNGLVDAVWGGQLETTTQGMALERSPAGTLIDYVDPHPPMWVFVVGFPPGGEDAVLARRAIKAADGWRVDPSDQALMRFFVAPNYTQAHFTYFVIDGPQPEPCAKACLVVGGLIMPDFRMLLTEPVEVESTSTGCQ